MGDNMAEENVSMDEVIINIVRENKLIYDKADVDYKKIEKRKDVWKMISSHLKEIYSVDMSAESIEKRWTVLRDMFCRELRRRKRPRSGFATIKGYEWQLFRPLLFLSPHIAHRKIQGPLKRKILQTEDSPSQVSLSFRKIAPLVDCKPTVITKVSQEMPKPQLISHAFIGSHIIENNTQSHPMDDFTKQQKIQSAHINEELVNACAAISSATTTLSTLINGKTNTDGQKDGYILAIEEGLKHVPGKCKTQCIIDVLQVIKKYEIRE